ncbi:MAG: hypothetical protein ACI9WU_003272 [Myxococcota bacterium]|jgi:hypothetical protein
MCGPVGETANDHQRQPVFGGDLDKSEGEPESGGLGIAWQ